MILAPENALVVGRVVGAHGIRGFVKVHSWTDPMDNILSYQPWYLRGDAGWEKVEVSGGRLQGKGLVARLNGCDDRTRAEREFIGREIAVAKDVLPTLEDGEFYWRDLIGLRVLLADGRDIGRVKELMETGANDVLVVKGDEHSLDRSERLVPWVPDQVVLEVDTRAGRITVDWDPTF